MLLIGDVHGRFSEYIKLLNDHKPDQSIQLGDFGLGFNSTPDIDINTLTNTKKKHLFIRGNHDNPKVCRNHPNYLGDFGTFKYKNKTVFFMSGAYSVDKDSRTEDVDWWKEEEFSIIDFNNIINCYELAKPDIVLTHDCPHSLLYKMYSYQIQNRTSIALQSMFEIHQPSLWFFGHHHKTQQIKHNGTTFHCLGELEYFYLK